MLKRYFLHFDTKLFYDRVCMNLFNTPTASYNHESLPYLIPGRPDLGENGNFVHSNSLNQNHPNAILRPNVPIRDQSINNHEIHNSNNINSINDRSSEQNWRNGTTLGRNINSNVVGNNIPLITQYQNSHQREENPLNIGGSLQQHSKIF